MSESLTASARQSARVAPAVLALVCIGNVCVASLGGCGDARPAPPVLQPAPTERDVRGAFGIPAEADRVLILSQSSHLDIDWKKAFEQYYRDHVEQVFLDAEAILDRDPRAYYSVAEMAYLAEHVAAHGDGAWPRHLGSGHARVVGGGMTTPDTLLPTDEALLRDYLLGTEFAERLGARPHAAWLPDSFGHSPTVPDLLSSAGFTSVGFGRADGARRSYEVIVGKLDPVLPGATTTASVLRDLGTADFVWRGPGGGEVLAHYMPVREYCQGDTIDLAGIALGGTRIGVDHDDDPAFVRGQLDEYITQLTPYQRTPYMFVPVGCDFQPPRPNLTQYAQWWNDAEYARTGVWVTTATFEDYMRLVAFHRDALPVMERDITPVWTGFYASRPRVKRAARELVDSLVGVEPFLALLEPRSVELAAAWRPAVLANHHDWITGTSKDAVVTDEQLPQLTAARAATDQTQQRVKAGLAAAVDTTGAAGGEVVVVVNPGPLARSEVVEVPLAITGPVRARAGELVVPAQPVAPDRVAFVAEAVPALGWRTFSIEPAAAPGASVTLDASTAHLSTGRLEARWSGDSTGWALSSLAVDGAELLADASLVWVTYHDTGGLYRIGSERVDCADAEFVELQRTRFEKLSIVEAGPARVTLRGTAKLDGRPMTVDMIAAAGGASLELRVTGSAATDRTIMLRVQPSAADDALTMGVAAGVVTRPLAHHYEPSLWPAVTWVARGELAVHLGQSTAVHGTPSGALEWVAFRNAPAEPSCDDVGPSGIEDGEATIAFSLGRRDRAGQGAADVAASIALSRPLWAALTGRHAGTLAAEGRLVSVDGDGVLVTALKPATRGDGAILHLLRLGSGPRAVRIDRGALPWTTLTRPDALERDDVPFGEPTERGVTVTLDAAVTAVRLTPTSPP
ncbi:MAG: hypothetical protein IT374_03435 [Polyangiaceae bacterium]|nr:hypothetical protein [Polyangiaceae bacterium]